MNNRQKSMLKLIRLLLDDDNGVSSEVYDQLWLVGKQVGLDCQKELGDKVDATDGRWYFPSR